MCHGAMNRHQEFLRFLKQVAKAYPDRELHLVMDNYATHKNTEVRDWPSAEAPSPGPPTSPDVRSGDTSPSSWIRRSP
jgi:hypothetical protein